MEAESPHTAPGCPHPGYMTTCPQARPVTLPLGDGECPQNLLQHPLEEHVMARHLGHKTNISSFLSQDQLVSPQCPHADVSLLPTTLPAVVSLAPGEPTPSATPPCAREVPHLHIQTSNI
jgi:hypothetical protein